MVLPGRKCRGCQKRKQLKIFQNERVPEVEMSGRSWHWSPTGPGSRGLLWALRLQPQLRSPCPSLIQAQAKKTKQNKTKTQNKTLPIMWPWVPTRKVLLNVMPQDIVITLDGGGQDQKELFSDDKVNFPFACWGGGLNSESN